jgi:hypothetical protein
MLGRKGKIELAVCIVYPHGSNYKLRKQHINEAGRLMQSVPPGVPIWAFGDWNFVQNPAIDSVNQGPKAKNEGLVQWQRIAKDIHLVELLDRYGGDTRTRDELTYTPFDAGTSGANINRISRRLDWFCGNKEARQLVDTSNIRGCLSHIPPWFKPGPNAPRAGTDHATVTLDMTLPNAPPKREKIEACANAAILRGTVPGGTTYAEKAEPILMRTLELLAEGDMSDAEMQKLQDKTLIKCVREAFQTHEKEHQRHKRKTNVIPSIRAELTAINETFYHASHH